MTESPTARKHPHVILRVLRSLVVVSVVVALGGFMISRQNVHRFEVEQGDVVFVKISVPIRRLARSHKYVVDTLPVECHLGTTGPEYPGVYFTVTETGHGIQKMWAEIRIIVTPSAKPGARKRHLEFTIDGEGDWPRQTLTVDVP